MPDPNATPSARSKSSVRSFYGHSDKQTVAVHRWMIEDTRDANGDANPTVAMLLAQITWWMGKDTRSGKDRCSHVHGGHSWLVAADDEWDEEMGFSARQVKRAKRRLIELGFIEVKTLVDDGVRCSHIRRLTPVDEPSTIGPKPHFDISDNPRPSAGFGPVQEPVLARSHAGANASSSSRESGERTTTSPDGDTFAAFWEAYPLRNGKRIGRADAEKVWARMTPDDRQAAMVGAGHLATAVRLTITLAPDAHRWLRGRRWEEWQTPAVPDRPNGTHRPGAGTADLSGIEEYRRKRGLPV